MKRNAEKATKVKRILPVVPVGADEDVTLKSVVSKQLRKKELSSPVLTGKDVSNKEFIQSSGPKVGQGRTPLRYVQLSSDKANKTPKSAPGIIKSGIRPSPSTPKRITHKPPPGNKGFVRVSGIRKGTTSKQNVERGKHPPPTARIEPMQLFQGNTESDKISEAAVECSFPKPIAEVKPSSRVLPSTPSNNQLKMDVKNEVEELKVGSEEVINLVPCATLPVQETGKVLPSVAEAESETENYIAPCPGEDDIVIPINVTKSKTKTEGETHELDLNFELTHDENQNSEGVNLNKHPSFSCDSGSGLGTNTKDMKKDVERVNDHQNKIVQKAEEYLTPRSTQQPLLPDVDNCSVKVAVRVRPFLPREKEDESLNCCIKMGGNQVTLTSSNDMTHTFTYDKCLWSFKENDCHFVGQDSIFQEMGKPLLDNAVEGFNTCLFAYGQTGSGKSYTMMGYHDEEAGIVPRFIRKLFEKIEDARNITFTVEVSFFEIYNERIHDLLSFSKDHRKQLKVREHPDTGPYVQDLAMFIVRSYEDAMNWLEIGNKNRATATTGMNDKSSRSHSIFTILLTQTQVQIFEETETQLNKTSKINLIDLAGSERASQVINEDIGMDSQVANTRLKEGGCINKSLHTLGKVIAILSDREKRPKKKMFIPYRDSVLTWLLKESLGGNSKTAMIATVSPSNAHYGETLSTLRYAQQARHIVNHTRINEDPNAKIIRELLAEIERLRHSAGNSPKMEAVASLAEADILRQKLRETQMVLSESMREWRESLEYAEKRRSEETSLIKRRSGVALRVDNRLPNLVNLNEDPQLSEVLLYMLNEGDTSVGAASPRNEHDIQLTSTLVADKHCNITNEGDFIFLTPTSDAPTYVNGIQITDKCELHHGDRIVIGGDHFFRLNHPKEVEKLKLTGKGVLEKAKKDFEFARNEFLRLQNARLEAELEDAKIKAQTELVKRIEAAKEEAQKEINSQRGAYEEQLGALQMQLSDTESKKQEAEHGQMCAEEKISRLKEHQKALEEEIYNSRKRLQMEALAAKQALEETRLNRIRILSALESEENKLKQGVEKMKELKTQRRKSLNSALVNACQEVTGSTVNLLQISLMLREANKISEKFQKDIVFCRDDLLQDEKLEVSIRVDRVREGLSAFWTLQKFQEKLERFREYHSKCHDVLQRLQPADQKRCSKVFVNGETPGGDVPDPFVDTEQEYVPSMRILSPDIRTRSGVRLSLEAKRNSLSLLNKLNKSIAEEPSSEQESALKSKQAKIDAVFTKHRQSLEGSKWQPFDFKGAPKVMGRDKTSCEEKVREEGSDKHRDEERCKGEAGKEKKEEGKEKDEMKEEEEEMMSMIEKKVEIKEVRKMEDAMQEVILKEEEKPVEMEREKLGVRNERKEIGGLEEKDEEIEDGKRKEEERLEIRSKEEESKKGDNTKSAKAKKQRGVNADELCLFFQMLQDEQEEEYDPSITSSILRQIASLFSFAAKSKSKSKDTVLQAAVMESQHLFSIQGKIQAWKSVHATFATEILQKATSDLLIHLKTLRKEFLAIFQASSKKSSLNDWIDVRAEIEVMSALLGKMSLGAVDHISKSEDYIVPPSLLPKEVLSRFMEGQNQFLVKYLENSTESVEEPISAVRGLQLCQDQEVDSDLVDDVMNLLISASTLLQRTRDFLVTFTENRVKTVVPTWSLTRTLRGLVSSVSTFCNCLTKLGMTLVNVSRNADELDLELDLTVSSCDATKQLAKDGKSLKEYVVRCCSCEEKKTVIEESFHKMEFASKAVRVSGTVLIQNIERRLEVNQNQSFTDCVEEDFFAADVNESFCPLISRQLNTSSRLTFNLRRKSRLSLIQQSTMSELYSPTQ